MYISNITDVYRDNENEDISIIFKYFFLSIASSILLLCLISLITGTFPKPLFSHLLYNG